MSSTVLFTSTLLISTISANLFSSGMFLVRISSERQHNIQYCFTELPYTWERRQNSRCLKSGELNIAKRTEKVIDLRLMNSSKAYLSIELTVSEGNQGPAKIIKERVVVDGALPAKRVAVASGLVMDFITICDRPWYGLMCSRYCIEHSDAHYVCDPRGEKVCTVGWTGKDCDIATKNIFPSRSDETTEVPPISSATQAFPSTGRLPTQESGTITVRTTSVAPATRASTAKRTKRPMQTASTPVRHSNTERIAKTTRIPSIKTSTDSSSHKVSTSTQLSSRNKETGNAQSTSSPVKQDSSSSFLRNSLILLLLIVSILALGFLLMICTRNSSVQNWINTRKAKIFAHGSCPSPSFQRYDLDIPTQKIFVIETEKTVTKIVDESEEEFGPRYSSQPTSPIDKPLSVNDTSAVESNTYHEIDSFFVPAVADLRIATLV
ncbi:hypothetical protein RB195_013144 [Necator americanus]